MASMNTQEELIPKSEAVAIAKLLGEVAGDAGDPNTRKRLLMRRLKELTDADGWLWSITHCDHSKEQPASVGVIYEDLEQEQFNGWLEASQLAKEFPPEDIPLGRNLAKGEHFTRTRDQLVSDAEWYNHPTVKKYRLDRGIDHFLYSLYPLDGTDTCSAIGLFRRVGRDNFSESQRRICHIILSQVEWLHFSGLPGHKENVFGLTERQRITLIHLLSGKRREEIADVMNISPETVKDHTRAVFKHYKCKNQLELVVKFKAGEGCVR